MLDVLFKIKDELDPTLAFRRSCRCAFWCSQAFNQSCGTIICVQLHGDPVKERPLQELSCTGKASVGPAL